ncbi:MAG TPA: copper resistance protein CopC [Candidatus Limnocylindria bacterium]|nr:copper resistance protein CopC [Candidatus Limnocylindria bacterium]
MLAVVLWLLLPGPVAAHSELISSNPAANASLKEAPSELSMTFTEPIDPATASVQLLDENQAAIEGVGDVEAPGDATVATITLPSLDPGVYTVSYRVTSATDGHVTSGIFAFQIDPTGTVPAPTGSASSSSPSSDPATVAARWVALVAALVLFGTALFWLASARPAMGSTGIGELGERAVWAVLGGLGALAVAALAIYLTLAAQPFTGEAAAAVSGHAGHELATSGGFPLDFAAPFGSTSFAWAMRLALAASGLVFLLATGRFFFADAAVRHGERLRSWAVPLLVVVACASALSLAGSSLAGHASSLGGPLFGIFDWLHLLAVGAWLGTVPGLLLLAGLSRGTYRRATVIDALRRHSRIALVAAPIVALTGLANSPIVLGDSRGLVASAYGDLLVAKALLFSVAVAIGSANFFLVKRGAARRTLQLVVGEVLVGAVAVVVAATMITIQPAASRVPVLSTSAIGTLHLYGAAGPVSVHAAISLPSPGEQQYQLSVADAASGAYLTDVQKVFMLFTPPPESNLPAERIELKAQAPPGLWSVDGAYTPIVGDWTVDVIVRREGQRDVSTTFPLPVQQPLPPQRVPPPDDGIQVPAPVAALWLLLPSGTPGWLLLIGLLVIVAALAVLDRRSQRAGRPRPSWSMPLRLAAILLLLVAALGVGSRAIVETANAAPGSLATNPIPEDLASATRGSSLYLANCANCHGADGKGNGPTAAGLLPAPPPLSPIIKSSTDGDLAHVITTGVSGTAMPAFATTLSENDRWDLVNYLRTLSRR